MVDKAAADVARHVLARLQEQIQEARHSAIRLETILVGPGPIDEPICWPAVSGFANEVTQAVDVCYELASDTLRRLTRIERDYPPAS
jgi:hypothetical protein